MKKRQGFETILNSSFEPRPSNLHRIPPKVLSRLFNIRPYLPRQLQRRAELLLPADQLVEAKPHGVAVDVRIEVEDVAFNGRGVVLVQCGAHADVGHALEGAVEVLEARGGDEAAAAGKEVV